MARFVRAPAYAWAWSPSLPTVSHENIAPRTRFWSHTSGLAHFRSFASSDCSRLRTRFFDALLSAAFLSRDTRLGTLSGALHFPWTMLVVAGGAAGGRPLLCKRPFSRNRLLNSILSLRFVCESLDSRDSQGFSKRVQLSTRQKIGSFQKNRFCSKKAGIFITQIRLLCVN